MAGMSRQQELEDLRAEETKLLGKLESYSKRIPMQNVNPATAHLFIIQPFSGQSMLKLFSTHPSTEDRIARLEAMRRGV